MLRETNLGKRYLKWIEDIAVPFCSRLALKPNTLTFIGLFFSLLTIPAYMYSLWLGGIGVLVSGTLDTLDGGLAKKTNQQTRSGAFLDAVLDRYSDFFAVVGIWLYFFINPLEHPNLMTALLFLFLTGSFLVSYSRARGEGLGLSISIGYLSRAERVIALGVGSILNDLLIIIFPYQAWLTNGLLFIALLFLLALGTHLTALQRILYLYNNLDSSPK
ncbi:MAG: CDP-alcohol phosphatidyltransferase family protein [Thermodesulfobacteriota bacterium]